MSNRTGAEISFRLHAKQGVALETRATEVLYGGAAGGGKSHLMRVAAIMWCGTIPGLQVYLFRRLRDDLIKNHIEGPSGLRLLLAPWVLSGLVSIVEDEIRFWNGSKIYLCHCKDEKDRFKYLGAEIHVLLIDELTTFTDKIYRFLRSRVRMSGVDLPPQFEGLFPRILCGSNPGNVGHQWVKSGFISPRPPLSLERMPAAEGGMVRQYIPAKLADNPSLDPEDYSAKLEGLGNSALVAAMRDGDWNVIAGAFFDCWSTDRHVIKPFSVPPHWVKFGAFDWGSTKPFSMQWWCVSDGNPLQDGRLYPTGALILYRQWYGAQKGPDGATVPNTGLRLSVQQIAEGIKTREGRDRIDYRVADPACWKVDGGPSHAETMMQHGVTFRRADNSRVTGWTQLHDRMIGQDGEPMLYVFDTCHDFIRTVPALQHDEAHPEDVDSDGEDHDGDAARYACMSRPWTRQPDVIRPMRGTDGMTMAEAWKLAKPQARTGAKGRI